MANIITTGQLAGSSATLQTGGGPVTIHLHNTHTSGLAVVLTLVHAGGTAVTLYSRTLDAGGSAVIKGLQLGPNDVVSGYAGTASKVDYFFATCDERVPFETQTYSSAGALKTARSDLSRTYQIAGPGKVGGTSGWTLAAANDLGYIATVAAGQSAGTLVLRINGLAIGDTITGFRVIAQIESAGNSATLDADLRAITNVAAEPTDASIATMTQVAVTADAAVSQAKTGLSEVVTSGKSYYLLLTATTAASTDIILQYCEITTQSV